MEQTRNSTLDVLKLLASYMVIFIHVGFGGQLGIVMDALARFAVPLFFLVSGYYSYHITPKKIISRVFSLVQLLIFTLIVYSVYDVWNLLLNHDIPGIIQYFSAYTDRDKLFMLVVFNAPVYTQHPWFLFASIYVYCIFFFVTIWKIPDKLIFLCAILSLLLHLYWIGFLSVFGTPKPIPFVRNFALIGFPFFVLGLFVHKHHQKLLKIPASVILPCILIGIVETVLSRYIIGKNELYIGSVFILFALVIVFVKFPHWKLPKPIHSMTGCSTYIYVFHPLISYIIGKWYWAAGSSFLSPNVLQFIYPLFVCAISTFVAYLLLRIRKLLPKKH